MVKQKEIRDKIVALYKTGLSERVIVSRLLEPKSTVHRIISCFKKTGSTCDKPRRPRKRPVRSRKLIETVRKRLKRNPHRNLAAMAKELNISRTSMRRVFKSDLNMRCYKFVKRQVLSEATMLKRMTRGKKIKSFLKASPRPDVIWTDEKIFTVEQTHNRQNDRLYCANIEDIPLSLRTCFIRQHPASVMVWGGVCDNGLKTPLIVIPQGVKVNSQVYIELLETQVLGWINEQDWQQGYCFMQDGAPSHTSRITQAWCKENFSTFWDKETWPPSSPDLNPMDFSV